VKTVNTPNGFLILVSVKGKRICDLEVHTLPFIEALSFYICMK
jgi:hypothetical protein